MVRRMTITKCLKKIIVLGQIFGYFPVQDISAPLPTFSYKSLRFLYSLFSICGAIFMCLMQLNKAAQDKMAITQIDHVAKYFAATYVAAAFVDLARHWPQLMKTWKDVEEDMSEHDFPRNLNRKIAGLMGFFTITFLVQYMLLQTTRVYRVIECDNDQEKAIKFFFGNLTLSHVFNHVPYNIPTSMVFHYWICQMEFAFTYTDMFVMVISMCLTSEMQQVTRRIKTASHRQIVDKQAWINLRKDYTRLATLCQEVNDQISNIILVSFLPNVFMILTRVYGSLTPKHNYEEMIYYYFSLAFLLSRAATVCICGSMVNEESRKPLNVLNAVSHTVYNDEIEIFINQLLNFEISLNGKHFFEIKRHVILEIAGAIVTYELVLIQFNRESLNSWARSTRCG